ncbi:hypothetical protein BKA01_003148 [Pseudonocardia eucalypti]|nr:hypothetical protein [Pseudonocardia eucalypti]
MNACAVVERVTAGEFTARGRPGAGAPPGCRDQDRLLVQSLTARKPPTGWASSVPAGWRSGGGFRIMPRGNQRDGPGTSQNGETSR